MKNRAKCRLCQETIESFHRHDYVTCKCGEIAVDGGLDYWRCSAKSWDNFLRIDDEGNEIVPLIKDKEESTKEDIKSVPPPTKKELLGMLDEMIASYERLPEHARTQNPTNYDLAAALLLLSSILRSDCKDEN